MIVNELSDYFTTNRNENFPCRHLNAEFQTTNLHHLLKTNR